jgi:DNA gyrase subunit A
MSEEWSVEYRLRKARERRHIVSTVVDGAKSWVDVLTVIAESPSADEARPALQERFGLDETQATALLDMQFRRVAGLDRQRLADELCELDAEIAQLEGEL